MKTIYEFRGGRYNGRRMTLDQILPISDGRVPCSFRLRAELHDQPKVPGYLGPMYNGVDGDCVVLRYETSTVYREYAE